MKTPNTVQMNHLNNKGVLYLNPDTNTLSICIRDQWGFEAAFVISYDEAVKIKELCEKFINKADKEYEIIQQRID